MSTTEPTSRERAKRINARLAEIAPYPDTDENTTATSLARHLAVRASVISHQQLSPDVPMSRHQIDLLTVLFAASHALFALADLDDEDAGTRVALEIRNAWEDGGGIGEWLWDHLGSSVCAELGPLADELSAAQKPAGGLLAHASAIRDGLSLAAMQARTPGLKRPYLDAIAELENELDAKREATP